MEFLELVGKDFRDNYGYNTGGGANIVSDLRLGATVHVAGRRRCCAAVPVEAR